MNESELLLQHYKEYFNKQEGNPYPCSNQSVGNIIFMKSLDSPKTKQLNGTWLGRNKVQLSDGLVWTMVPARDCSRGYRAYRAIVDKDIDFDILKTIVIPCCAGYCCSFEIF